MKLVSLPLLVLTLLCAGTGAVFAQGFQGVDPGQPFPVKVESGVIPGTLPFDVPFYFTDGVSDAVSAVEGWGLGFKKPQNCNAVLAATPPCSATTSGDVDCYRLERVRPEGAQGSRSFSLPMPALQPNRYHCFQFRLYSDITDPVQRSRVEASVKGAVETVLNQSRWLTATTVEAVEELRRQLLQDAQASLEPGEVLYPEPGSFFDTSTPVSRFDATIGSQVADVIMAQRNVVNARTVLQQVAAQTATGALARLSSSPLWRITAGALQANAAQPRVSQFLAGRQDALLLIGLSQSDVVARSEGHAGTLDRIWTSGEIDLGTVRRQLVDLRNIAAALRADGGLRQVAGLGDADLAALLAQACGSTIPPGDPVCATPPPVDLFFQGIQDLANGAAAAFDDGLEGAAASLKGQLDRRSRLLDDFAEELRALLLRVADLRASTVADYETQATWYMSADLGTALAWDFEEAFLYAGANIYFRPVNKKADLSWDDWKKGQRWTELRKRFSLMVGLPQDKLDLENTEPVLQDRPLLIGAGLRLNRLLRVTLAGFLVFKEVDPNPLVEDERLAWSPFVGVSIDWNVAGNFQKMFQGVFNPGAAAQLAQPAQQGDR